MASIEQRLLGHALALDWRGLPEAARAATRAFVCDTLAVGTAGHNAMFAREVRTVMHGWSGPAPTGAFILGSDGTPVPASTAAFINAYQIHAQEFDCVHEPAVAHPMATVCAALLAQASHVPVAGQDFLAAVVAGVDVVATLGVAAKGPLRFFRPATAGIFGSVCALARLRRLSPSIANDALGHALGFAGGTMQAHVEGKPTLALQVAAAARGAIEAVDLACAGIPAPQEAIGGAFGFLSLLETDTHVEPELDRLGKEWRITQLSWKPFPTGRAAHGALVALRQMMDEHAISADNLQSFTYRAPSLIQRLVGRPARADMTGAYARLCFAWLGALQLRNGSIGLADFTPATIADPDLLALSRRLTIEADDNPDLAAFVPAAATAVRHDGQSFHVAVDRQFGAPGWPLDHDQQIDKARRCLTFGGLDGTRTEALFAAVERLDSEADAAAALRAVTTRTIPA